MSSFSLSWSCSKCTYLNSPSQTLTCKICLSPTPSSSSSSSSSHNNRWSCGVCTFSNLNSNPRCEMCGSKSPLASSFLDLVNLEPDEISDHSVGSVFLPLRRCGTKRRAEEATGDVAERTLRGEEEEVEEAVFTTVSGLLVIQLVNLIHLMTCIIPVGWQTLHRQTHALRTMRQRYLHLVHADSGSNNTMLKILSYNVWFREDLEVHKRMKALGDLIQTHLPDLICLQEVTPYIYEIFRHSDWWKMYRCSLSQEMAIARPYFCMQLSKLPVKAFKRKPFDNSIMGRELCIAEIDIGMNKKLVVATSHLESPSPAPPKWDQMYSKERVTQAKESLGILKDYPNVIFGGDMNWDDKLDGSFPLNGGWVDAWNELRAGENGWTYDKSNQMLSGNRTLQKRLDRFVCILKDFKIESIEMIGKEAIPGISYCKEKKVRKEVKKLELPVLPSDHYGLLLTIQSLRCLGRNQMWVI